ncbi:class I SAM-dependent methyltransferase [Neobacillus dielmonensis]|uniref:class I SAM-dependent methyltransferase n=1 Tax=Neobacillus dielmonensis TaxID=1347369 RepID=UPI0005A842E9|nr:class I SAM-dependent methyltransferase [Neobacillus dielmonensis]
MTGLNRNNIERFNGYGSLYDQNRPSAPNEVVKIVTTYLKDSPKLVVDVGCGTGLSTFIWLGEAEKVIGVEPNDDMREVAVSHWEEAQKPSGIIFVKALSHQLGLPDETADIITCSQSFHWMEPQSTLKEFARVLRPNGIFAAYDCDWPPTCDWNLEEHFMKLYYHADEWLSQLLPSERQAHKWKKENHLHQIQQSGLFSFSKEIVFHHWEKCDAARYANIAYSQGGLQTALKLGVLELETAFQDFRAHVEEVFSGETKEILFSYRMRLGVKK